MTTPIKTTDTEKILAAIARIDEKLNTHLLEDLAIKPELRILVGILQQSRGVLTLLKVVLYVGAPLTALTTWFKDHIK